MAKIDYTIDEWNGCYPSQWKGLIVPQAMSHPAKFSSRLIRRIYDHMLEEGWLRIGDRVLDPFGGVALGSLEAMRHGLQWQGIELEAKFVDLGGQNIDLWNKKFSRMPHWGSGRLVQGDSRFILKVLAEGQQGVVSSPPYADTPINQTHMTSNQRGDPNNPNYRPSLKTKLENGFAETKHDYGSTPGQLGAMHPGDFDAALSSPPFNSNSANAVHGETKGFHSYDVDEPRNRMKRDYILADDPENLGNLSMDGFSAAITSPPFRQSEGGTPEPKPGGPIDDRLYARHAAGNSAADGYGTTPGNLANMDEPSGDFNAVIASPKGGEAMTGGGIAKNGYQNEELRKGSEEKPFDLVGKRSYMPDNQGLTPGQLANLPAGDFEGAVSSPPFEQTGVPDHKGQTDSLKHGKFIGGGDAFLNKEYGNTEGQIGNDSGETFWQAARQIVEQVYLALAPGGHAVWVVKNYVKNKQIVPFCDQWRQLCESVGFVTLHEHHAMLVHDKGTSHTLEGGTVNHKTESKSFFRRLAEKNGSPRIDYEVVFCMVKE